MIDYRELDNLFSRKALSKLSKNPKKAYKNALISIFITGFKVGNYEEKQKDLRDNILVCHSIAANPLVYKSEKNLASIEYLIQKHLNMLLVKEPSSDKTLNLIIDFMRNVIKAHLNGNRYLTKFIHLNELFNVKHVLNNLYKHPFEHIRNHHWIEYDVEKGIIPTFPEFITYANLVSLWNMYIDKTGLYKQALLKDDERITIRTLEHEVQALLGTLLVQGVTFVESYLYYIFFNIKVGNYNLTSTKAQKFINVEMPDDNQIIESLILAEFAQNNNLKKLKSLHSSYKVINKKRNRFIHASAFENENTPDIMPLITLKQIEIIKELTICTELVLEVEKLLPEQFKILFWWGNMNHPNYTEEIKGDFIKRTDI